MSDDSSGSDFDEDPDEIGVPGGGKDLATVVSITSAKESKPAPASALPQQIPSLAALPSFAQQQQQQQLQQMLLQQQRLRQQQLLLQQQQLQQQLHTQKLNSQQPQLSQYEIQQQRQMLQQNLQLKIQRQRQVQQQQQFLAQQRAATAAGLPPGMTMLAAPPGGQVPFNKQLGLTGKEVSSMWMNADPKQLPIGVSQAAIGGATGAGIPEEEEEDEELGVAETYADYMPSKLKLGRKHPDPVVETASLSSVEPSDVWYKLSIPEETIRSGALSALQLESITYASQQHEHLLPDGSRAGFFIGDGAGVGKGRTIAGIIFENYLKGRKRAIWVSVSNDLKYDAERDLLDIGASRVDVYSLSKFKYAKISSTINGNVKKGVVFSTYSALIGESSQTGGKYKSRLKQLLQWCGEDFDGLIIFDECHRAKNLSPTVSSKPSKTGLTVLELQNKLPKARVVYASATGASEPRNMAYMVRLGMWGKGTPFQDFNDFIIAVERRGVGAMEIVAMDMKLRGMYIARQLSFYGVTFKIEEVPLSADFKKIYDQSVQLWVEAMHKFYEASNLIDAESRMKKTMWSQFWSAHQRFFKYLCIAAKVKHTISLAREALKCGKCVVIGLQSTGEARTLEQLERDDGELSDFVSTAKGVFQSLVEKHFPAPDRNRIHRVLGLGIPQTTVNIVQSGNHTTNTNKRKAVEPTIPVIPKKMPNKLFDDNLPGEENGKHDSDSEAKINASDSEDELQSDEENSDANSDYNPFDSDSDSDVDPWDRRKKKDVKKPSKSKAKKKKSSLPSTQETLQSMLTKKVTTNIEKNNFIEKSNGTTSSSIDTLILPGEKPILPSEKLILPGEKSSAPASSAPTSSIERACSIKEELLAKIEALGEKLPPNTLDQLIDELGGPENVAEMTGRKGRVVQLEDGSIQYESRSETDVPLETLNLTEKQRFMDGEKTVAIISEAASSGISLQADRRARNQMRRVHITLELPWSADRAIQQFGRTHRSNQVNAPEYVFLISNLAGERRFASIVAKRLESLGALTHGDRRATESRDLSQFNIDNKYGRTALEASMKAVMGFGTPMVPPPQDYRGNFFEDISKALVGVGLIEDGPYGKSLDKDYNNMSKFLNRILGVPVELQNRFFKYFTDTLNAIIGQAKRSGRFDMGILDLGASGENVRRVKLIRFLRKHATGVAPTELHVVQVERGMSWPEAVDRWEDSSDPFEGFYLSHQIRNGKRTAVLIMGVDMTGKKIDSKKDQLYMLYRPNTGLQLRQETLQEIEKKYKKVSSEEIKPHWLQQYEASLNTCSHAYWRGNCRNVTLGIDCEIGLRRRSYNVLSGSVLSVWSRIESVLASRLGNNSKMQVVRLRTDDNLKIVGTLIPKSCMESLRQVLSAEAEKVVEHSF